ncbi:uncharacterized protein LOC135812313 [Sycon ciliatum]|uniref:uncharacterized protein LOC135812313 n=1 Tax=Sycon ciliatum TaxID=27933 RepID=UPI0031F689B7
MASSVRKDSRLRMIQAARKPSLSTRVSVMKKASTVAVGGRPLQQRMSMGPRTSRAISRIAIPRRESRITRENKAEPGGVDALVKAIRCFPSNEGLIRECCGALASYSPSILSEWESVRTDAIEVLSNAMTTFSSKDDLILAIVDALIHLVTLEEESPENICNLLVKKDIVRRCLVTMEANSSNVAMHISCLRLIGFAALSDAVTVDICSAGALDATLKSMEVFSSNSEVQSNACLVLGNLCVNDDVAEQADKKGASSRILNAISQNRDNTELLDSACRALGSLAMNHDLCMKLVRTGGIDLVLQLMTSHPDEEKIQECGCWALACFSSHDDAVSNVLERGGLQQVVTTMDSGYLSATVQEYGCRIIVNLSMPAGQEDVISKKEVMDVLIAAMDSYDNNVAVNEQATFALSKILATNERLQSEFVEAGGVKLTIDAMKHFPENEGVHENGILILGNIVMEDSARTTVLELEGLETILQTMKLDTCRENLILQCVGCNTVGNLIAEDCQHKETVVKQGGLQAVIGAMKVFESNDELQECACRVLAYLASSESLHSDLIESGSDSLVLLAMEKHTNNIDLLEAAIQALQMLSPSSDGASCSEAVHCAIKQTMLCLQQHPEDENVFSVACQVLSGYALSPYSHHWMVEEGFINVVVDRLKQFSKAADIQGYGCQLLGLLCFTSELCQKLLSAGILQRLCVAMETCACDVQLQITCCGALTCLVSECPSQTFELLAPTSFSKLIVEAMRNHSDNMDLLLASYIAVKFLAGNPSTRKQLLDDDAASAIQAALSNFPQQEELQTEAAEVLRKLK